LSLLTEEDAMPLVRIQEVEPLGGYRLRLVLTNGAEIERDVGPLLSGPVFEPIRSDESLFRGVRVQGGTVAWPNGVDLCPDTLIWGGLPPDERAD